MASIGPQLPSKRKHDDCDTFSSPRMPKTTRRTADDPKHTPLTGSVATQSASTQPIIGPTLPPPRTSSPPPRTIGPAFPSARATVDLNESPHEEPDIIVDADDNGSDDDDDDYGPALPSNAAAAQAPKPSISAPVRDTPPAAQRDSWMLAPPTEANNRAPDPTKLKPRKFATGRASTSASANGTASEAGSIWTETVEEKRKRLADAVLGRGTGGEDPSPGRGGRPEVSAARREEEARLNEYSERRRGRKSLYEQHQEGKQEKVKAEEDDPSKRAFDKEKDMALGGKIGTAQRRELLNRASDFGGRFTKGSQ